MYILMELTNLTRPENGIHGGHISYHLDRTATRVGEWRNPNEAAREAGGSLHVILTFDQRIADDLPVLYRD